MENSPEQIAAYLVKRDGVSGAMQTALAGVLDAQTDRDNYTLSVWREVKAAIHRLADEQDTSGDKTAA